MKTITLKSVPRISLSDWSFSPRMAIIASAVVAFILFLTTCELGINGSSHPYTTDVGEIQNALPRWGTIHYTGYPLYTALGSAFVTLLRVIGISPALGSSIYAAAWGAISIGLLTSLILAFEVRPLIAATSAVLFALTTSMWVFASVAEVHTMTMALTFAILLVALRYKRTGQAKYLYWLAFLAGQGLAHQRAFVFLGLGLLLLVIARLFAQWRVILRKLPVLIGLALLGPLTYLYLPLRAQTGADWLFSSPGTWNGFWALFLDNKTDRIVELPQSMVEWWQRLQGLLGVLHDDLPWLLLLLGFAGLLFTLRRVHWVERASLILIGASYAALSLIIWIGRVGEAVLAAKLTVVAIAIIGLAFMAQSLWERKVIYRRVATALLIAASGFLYIEHRPVVLAVTRDPGAQKLIDLVARIPPAEDGRPSALMALWGNDYWQLAYAQAYQNQLSAVTLLKHDRNFGKVLNRGMHLLVLSHTFYERPVDWWKEQLGLPVHLSTRSAEVIEIAAQPKIVPVESDPSKAFQLGNGVMILNTDAAWVSEDTVQVTVEWQSQQDHLADYNVAVHLVAQDPPTAPEHVLAQADSAHPVDGWYPTSRWVKGEVVRDVYSLTASPGSKPVAVQIGMYQVLPDGQFQNSKWLSIPVPAAPTTNKATE
jgi:hypothetical protein